MPSPYSRRRQGPNNYSDTVRRGALFNQMLMPWSVFDKLTKMWSTVLKQYWQYHIWQTSALLQPRSPSLNICFCLKCVCSENEWEKSPFLVFDDKCESWEQSRARWKILRACISGNCQNCQQHWGGICNSRKTSENKSHHISQKKKIYFGNILWFLTDTEGGSVLGFV